MGLGTLGRGVSCPTGGASSVVTLAASLLLGVPWDLQGQAISTGLIPNDALSPELHLQVQVQRPADQGAQTPGSPGPQRHPPSSACLGLSSVPQPPDPIQSSRKPWACFLQYQSGPLSSLHPRLHLPPQAPTCCLLGAALTPCSPPAASLGPEVGLLQEQSLSNSAVSSGKCNRQLSWSTFCLPASLGADPLAPERLTPHPTHGTLGLSARWCPPRPTARGTRPPVAPGFQPLGFQHPCCCGGGSLTLCHPASAGSSSMKPGSQSPGPPLTAHPALLVNTMASVFTGFSAPWTAPRPELGRGSPDRDGCGAGRTGPLVASPAAHGSCMTALGARGRSMSLLSASISPRDFTWPLGSTSSEQSSPDARVQSPVCSPSCRRVGPCEPCPSP